MDPLADPHASEELLELYSLHGLPENERAPLEEHLLTCSHCQARLEDLDDFIACLRAALRSLSNPRREKNPPLPR
jgi:anti-sigma factor RsiW